MFGPLRLTRHRCRSATNVEVTTQWTLTVAAWSWTLSYSRPVRDTDRTTTRSWGWD